MRPRLLDLFCGAGGAAMGYHRAGFDVVGVDIAPQPNYPFTFIQTNALNVLRCSSLPDSEDGPFDAIHASPPCQHYSDMSDCRPGLKDEYEDLIGHTRELLQRTGLPYVIENVTGAPLAKQPTLDGTYGVELCGRMFGLDLYRHRWFETNFPVTQPQHPCHLKPASPAGHWTPGTVISVAGNFHPIGVARVAMGIGWMNRAELAEAIPPAYTEHIGSRLLALLQADREADGNQDSVSAVVGRVGGDRPE